MLPRTSGESLLSAVTPPYGVSPPRAVHTPYGVNPRQAVRMPSAESLPFAEDLKGGGSSHDNPSDGNNREMLNKSGKDRTMQNPVMGLFNKISDKTKTQTKTNSYVTLRKEH